MEEKILKIVQTFSEKKIKNDDHLIHGGLLTSINFINFIVRIEKEFKVRFSDEDYLSGKLDSVEQICKCISQHKILR